jgi:hypothetical protein
MNRNYCYWLVCRQQSGRQILLPDASVNNSFASSVRVLMRQVGSRYVAYRCIDETLSMWQVLGVLLLPHSNSHLIGSLKIVRIKPKLQITPQHQNVRYFRWLKLVSCDYRMSPNNFCWLGDEGPGFRVM